MIQSLAAAALLAATAAQSSGAVVICAGGEARLSLWSASGAKLGELGPKPRGFVSWVAMAGSTPVLVTDEGEIQVLRKGAWVRVDRVQAHGADRVARADERRGSAVFWLPGPAPDTFEGSLRVDERGRTSFVPFKQDRAIFRAPEGQKPLEDAPSTAVPDPLVAAAGISPMAEAAWAERLPWGGTLYALPGAAVGDGPPAAALWLVPAEGKTRRLRADGRDLPYPGLVGFGDGFALYQRPPAGPGPLLILKDGTTVKVGPAESARCALYAAPAPKPVRSAR